MRVQLRENIWRELPEKGSSGVSRMPGLSYYWLGSMSWDHWASWTIVYLQGRSGDGFCSYPVHPRLPLHGALHWSTAESDAGSGSTHPIHPCSVAAPPHDLMQRHSRTDAADPWVVRGRRWTKWVPGRPGIGCHFFLLGNHLRANPS